MGNGHKADTPSMTPYDGFERRSKARIQNPFPAIVRGRDANGRSFEIQTSLDNLSARGLYLRMAPRVRVGAKLFVVIALVAAPPEEIASPRVAVRATVLRVEPQPGGEFGIAVSFTRHRFL